MDYDILDKLRVIPHSQIGSIRTRLRNAGGRTVEEEKDLFSVRIMEKTRDFLFGNEYESSSQTESLIKETLAKQGGGKMCPCQIRRWWERYILD